MKLILLILSFGIMATALAKQRACESSNDSLLSYQREILKSAESTSLKDKDWIEKVSHPFSCLLEAQVDQKGISKYFAGSLLRSLLGADVVDGIPEDRRLQKVAARLSRLTLESDDIVTHSVVTAYEQGDFGFFVPCEGTGLKNCPIFIPEAKDVVKQAPMIAAAQMIHLKRAYSLAEGKDKREITEQLKELYLKIPATALLQRKVIDEIYDELFPVVRPISQV